MNYETMVNEIQSSSHTIYQNVLRVLEQAKDADLDRDEIAEFQMALTDEASQLFTAVGRLELMFHSGLLTITDIMEMRIAVLDTFNKCDGLIKAFQETL